MLSRLVPPCSSDVTSRARRSASAWSLRPRRPPAASAGMVVLLNMVMPSESSKPGADEGTSRSGRGVRDVERRVEGLQGRGRACELAAVQLEVKVQVVFAAAERA